MQWTKEKPKEPGYYWLRNSGSAHNPSKQLVEVRAAYRNSPNDLVFTFSGHGAMYEFDEIEPGAEWAGPVESPVNMLGTPVNTEQNQSAKWREKWTAENRLLIVNNIAAKVQELSEKLGPDEGPHYELKHLAVCIRMLALHDDEFLENNKSNFAKYIPARITEKERDQVIRQGGLKCQCGCWRALIYNGDVESINNGQAELRIIEKCLNCKAEELDLSDETPVNAEQNQSANEENH